MIKCWSWWCYIIIIIIINVAGGPTTRSFQNYHCNSKKVITSSSLWILQEVLLHTLLHILLHICWMPIRNNWWNYIRILIPKLEIVYPTKVPVLVILGHVCFCDSISIALYCSNYNCCIYLLIDCSNDSHIEEVSNSM